MMIVSIGIALAARHLYLFLVGGAFEQYGQYTLQRDLIDLGPIEYAPRSLWIICISAAVIIGVALFLLRARFGKAIRAVSDNPELASSSGIDSDRVILLVWILGGALAGLGGVMYGLEYGIRWDMGFTLLLLMFAAITLGGLGNPFGALVGSLVIGIFVELWTLVVPNANDMKNVGALVALIIVLLDPPAGNPRQQGAHRMSRHLATRRCVELGVDLLECAVHVDQRRRGGYCLVAVGLNVHVGYTGLLNFGQAGFAAVGAYAFAVPITEYDWPWYAALPLAFAVRSPSPCCSASRRCDCAPTTWRSSRSPPPRSSATSSARRGSPGSPVAPTAGRAGPSFFQDLNPWVNDDRFHIGDADLRRLPPVHDGPRLVARGSRVAARLGADAQSMGPRAEEHPRGRGRRPGPRQERRRVQDAEPDPRWRDRLARRADARGADPGGDARPVRPEP